VFSTIETVQPTPMRFSMPSFFTSLSAIIHRFHATASKPDNRRVDGGEHRCFSTGKKRTSVNN
jgi:hypothetical protein